MSSVVIAGWGLVSVLGPDTASAVAALRSGVRPAATLIEVPGLTGPQPRPLRAIDAPFTGGWLARALRLAQRAAAESGALSGDRCGPLFIATTSADAGAREESGVLRNDMHVFAERIAAALAWRGPVWTVFTACTSGLNALLDVQAMFNAGRADSALVLGVELRNQLSLCGFGSLQLLADDAAAPGIVLAEAVAALHLARESEAERGTRRWRLAGGASVVDGRDAVGCSQRAVIEACEQALHASGVTAAAIGCVKCQAEGGGANDAAEDSALQRVFAPHQPTRVALKPALGHTLGAAGVAETVLLLAGIEAGLWPLDPSGARHVMSCAFGFSGSHAVVVFEDQSLEIDADADADADAEAAHLLSPASPTRARLPAWRVVAQAIDTPPPDWRERLSVRLGGRPRRIGRWAELALYGARRCLDAAGLAELPPGARLRLASFSATRATARTSIPQGLAGTLSPFSFLQSQTSQVLAALSAGLGWQGDAQLLLTREPALWLDLVGLLAPVRPVNAGGLLIGWVEEELAPDEAEAGLQYEAGASLLPVSRWVWLQPEEAHQPGACSGSSGLGSEPDHAFAW